MLTAHSMPSAAHVPRPTTARVCKPAPGTATAPPYTAQPPARGLCWLQSMARLCVQGAGLAAPALGPPLCQWLSCPARPRSINVQHRHAVHHKQPLGTQCEERTLVTCHEPLATDMLNQISLSIITHGLKARRPTLPTVQHLLGRFAGACHSASNEVNWRPESWTCRHVAITIVSRLQTSPKHRVALQSSPAHAVCWACGSGAAGADT